jgi:hypothetical protein
MFIRNKYRATLRKAVLKKFYLLADWLSFGLLPENMQGFHPFPVEYSALSGAGNKSI